MNLAYLDEELEIMLADVESDLVERKESLSGDAPKKIRQAVCLAATKMIATADDPVPTVTGMLVIGTRPQDFLPGTASSSCATP